MFWKSNFVWDNATKTLRNRGAACRGLTVVLRESFFPNAKPIQNTSLLTFRKQRYGGGSKKKNYRDGIRTGIGIASLLFRWLKLQASLKRQGKLHLLPTVSANFTKIIIPRDLSAADKKLATSTLKRKCPYMRQFVYLLQHLNWRLSGVEVPVGYNRTATRVDAIAVDSSDCYHVIEIKCGYDGSFANSSGKMVGVMKDFPDCPFIQHSMQLLCTHMMARSTYPTLTWKTPLLVRLNNTFDVDKDVHLLPRVVVARASSIWHVVT